ncbi:DUF5677 domain-containing protein [Massilia sp. YIM B02769]|uniref:DUF5677 domain-containing protein n=1 Tax=Massilia sp. YIM B02769 TaxID=3050129 RepID=UPI0025B6AD58|nr:DUF5677 domain-containing protein [Massilia sp. YIM B02769]MDN4060245.1 DUF5677 domain-containing protein [Massilia sp. YIM B02769]
MKKMTWIQNAIDRKVAEVSSEKRILSIALAKAASQRSLLLTENEIQQLSSAILSAEDGALEIDLDPLCVLGATESDRQVNLQALVDDITKSLPEVMDDVISAVTEAIPEALASVARIFSDHMSEHLIEHMAELKLAHEVRSKAVHRIWGDVFDQLDFLRHLALEWGHHAQDLQSGPYKQPNTAFALNRLVGRAYEIVGEIVALTKAGYADGALARWRSLHELCVISMFIAKQPDRCAEMYLAHHQIEELRLLEIDRASGTDNDRDRDRDRFVAHLRRQKVQLTSKYGSAFGGDLGWASIELGRARTTFRELESLVGLDILRRGYQRANSTVHGGALATLTRISVEVSGADSTVVPAAYGCEVAAHYTTASLSMLVAELCLTTENADLITMSIVMQNHASKICEQIAKAQRGMSAQTPRAKILMRKASQRQSASERSKTRGMRRGVRAQGTK